MSTSEWTIVDEEIISDWRVPSFLQNRAVSHTKLRQFVTCKYKNIVH